jgi:Holliday junction DNA helicase RuvA
LAVHTHVREDVLALYGFHEPDERELFRALIGVGGIGPRVALAILSGIPAAELRRVVADGDRARLQKVPGVGKKTAERVLLELGDRMRKLVGTTGGTAPPSAEDRHTADEGPDARMDAISALVNLGYPEDRARRAVDSALAEDAAADGRDPELEVVLRAALRFLAR